MDTIANVDNGNLSFVGNRAESIRSFTKVTTVKSIVHVNGF